ncbi:MAG: twin-arginine translocase TatA/TatE family subunit [bacterium]
MTMPICFLQNIAPPEVLIIVLIIALFFGAKKIPDLARSLGRSLGEFKKGREEGEKLANEKVKQIVDDIKKEEPDKVEGPKA